MGRVLRKGDDECLKWAWNSKLEGNRGRGKPKLSWELMVVRECCKVGVNIEDAND